MDNPYDKPGLYNADCMEAMSHFPDKFFDLAIVDPPYGVNITGRHKKGDMCSTVGNVKKRDRPLDDPTWGFNKNMPRIKMYPVFDDQTIPDKAYFENLLRVSKQVIIWGGNYFLDELGKATCLIVWDKKRRGMDQADCEIAWTNLPGQSRIFEFKWNGVLQEDMKKKEKRIHPTQKPAALYEWLLQKYAKPGYKILDTHAGSASSLVACYRQGFDAWGFEISEFYYSMARKRLADEMAQVTIFAEQMDEVGKWEV